MKERIKKYMDYKSISAGELSSALEVQRSNISHILNGRNKPGAAFIEKLLITYPDLNARWLLTGTGEMIDEGYGKSSERNIQTADNKTKVKEQSLSWDSRVEKKSLKSGQNKPVEKVILLFSDGTFTDFDKNDI